MEKINRLAQDIHGRLASNAQSYTLVLGAGASISCGCPSWWQLCKEQCKKLKLDANDETCIQVFKDYLKFHASNKIDIYNQFFSRFKDTKVSLGYYHLAHLVSQGVFNTIITTNFDNLLEQALSMIMPIDRIKVFIRGEVPDQYIADFILANIPNTINIIKLHGDLRSNIFYVQDDETSNLSSNLREVLKKKLQAGSIIVGSEMIDSNVTNLYSTGTYNIFVNLKAPSDRLKEILNISSNKDSDQVICPMKSDNFFVFLNMMVQKLLLKSIGIPQQEEIENTILGNKEKGTNYIRVNDIDDLVSQFWTKIRRTYGHTNPDIISFINDPKAQGGIEMFRRLSDKIERDMPETKIERIKITGERTRYNQREVKDMDDAIFEKEYKNILIIDVISFTGNTLKIASDKYKNRYPSSEIRAAVMYKGMFKVDSHDTLNGLIYLKNTDRNEIIFPWGITQATSDCAKNLNGVDENYIVDTEKRPWGTIEVFARQKNCSVRILTIEAGQELSFQRHVARDEFFISLDDNIGLDICARNLEQYEEGIDINDIKEIKSLVLEKGDCFLIPKGVWHRTKAYSNRVRLLEIGYGIYDQENDIERLYDLYGRKKNNMSVLEK